MLITTSNGNVYRVNSAGAVTLLAATGEDTEGLDVAPLGGGFGPHDGSLIVASEGSGRIRAVTTGGGVTDLGIRIPGAEMLSFVPLNLGASGSPLEGFYAANFTPNVVKAPPAEFTTLIGDVIVTGEFTDNVSSIHFDPSTSGFVSSVIGSFPNQPEDGIFVTAAVITGGGGGPTALPEPATVLLFGATLLLGLAGSVAGKRRRF